MKLVEIKGKIWELTRLQHDTYVDEAPVSALNTNVILGLDYHRGLIRPLASNGVKSKATAIIEVRVSGYWHQIEYEIYHSSKGFYCNVQGKRVYLRNLATPEAE